MFFFFFTCYPYILFNMIGLTSTSKLYFSFYKISLKKNKIFPKFWSSSILWVDSLFSMATLRVTGIFDSSQLFFVILYLEKYFFKGLKFFMGKLMFYHDILLLVCYFVLFFMVSFMLSIILFSGVYLFNLGKSFLEVVWTFIPALILLFLVEPSLMLLYLSEAFSFSGGQTLKVVAHQWYWSYSGDVVKNFEGKEMKYDSYLVNSDLLVGDFRLLEVDLPAVILSKTPMYFFLSSSDVIHSFALPSLGVKVDAFPGRVKIGFSGGVPVGSYWGQCSEICGANHAFMPMKVESMIYF